LCVIQLLSALFSTLPLYQMGVLTVVFSRFFCSLESVASSVLGETSAEPIVKFNEASAQILFSFSIGDCLGRGIDRSLYDDLVLEPEGQNSRFRYLMEHVVCGLICCGGMFLSSQPLKQFGSIYGRPVSGVFQRGHRPIVLDGPEMVFVVHSSLS